MFVKLFGLQRDVIIDSLPHDMETNFQNMGPTFSINFSGHV